ncbi:contractile injection system protein, VgrG/Pvc8 family [Acinetobacter bereziniae]|uniref:contractile injection system protein, VgrG/Pvc8 family n=1 Tax=Acinetobacter bereziniae TaxID=106648 RepID=UPI002575D87A|nr:contractile injection system protein, VgrG/Pvc8 family [Acinetobacter bereziniae]MDM1784253.1 DNA primase [Acinetobacter bereziniae]
MLNSLTSALNTAIDSYNNSTDYPYPIFKVEVEGIDISSKIVDRLISLNVKDNRGLEVDSIDLELDDSDGLLSIPPEGAKIQVWLGWSNTGLIDKGIYKVESTAHRGTPDVLSITAFASDISEGLKQKRERSFSNKTIQDIFTTVATQYELKPIVHERFASKVIQYIAQNESDANLITRIADENDAIATVKNGHLLLLPRGASQTVSGLNLPRVTLTRNMGDQHSFTTGTGTDKVTAVKAFYYETNKSKKGHVVIGDNQENLKELRFVHRDKQAAEQAANAEYNRCKRGAKQLSYSLALGDPSLIPEQEYTFIGLKPEIDELIWLATNLTHSLGEQGLTTSIELELQLPDADDVSQLFEDIDLTANDQNKKIGRNYADYTGVIVYYKEKGNKSIQLTSGDQSKPLKKTHLYESKKSATAAMKREQARIDKAKKASS